ncbi:MAG TPA: hypothetical protein DCL35_06270 [Candidatus Omnitrophica bacterium]|nr:hypothetical protein [Candidatus Omnitrophota bacterium]
MIRRQLTEDIRQINQSTEGPKNRSFFLVFLFFSFFAFLYSVFLPLFSVLCYAQAWQELKGDHFIVYYEKQDERFAKDALRHSEHYYNDIASDLGYVRYSGFWQWDKRVKVFIYPSQDSFLKATGQPSWSVGNANYDTKQIMGFTGSDEFINSILAHEIAHLIFRDFVGFKGEVPLWLDEGVAQWQERPKRQLVKFFVRSLMKDGKLMKLKDLTAMDVRKVPGADEAKNFYIQAASLVGFMIEEHGPGKFADFCRQLRDGKSLDDALRFAYPAQMRDLGELEEKWLKYVSGIKVTVQRRSGDVMQTISYK